MRWITPKRLLKIVFAISAVGFILMNISLLFRDDDPEIGVVNDGLPGKLGSAIGNTSGSGATGHVSQEESANDKWSFWVNSDTSSSNGSQVKSILPRMASFNGNLSALSNAIWTINRQQNILNLDRFDLVASESTIVIVVQVHNRPEYLRHLVRSLSHAADIQHTLLIFSHDFYSDELNDIIGTINFAPVMQIFYPYSMQLYPNAFPGEDPRDCPRNVNREQAKQIGCLNHEYPDKYGHYREAKYSQTKNHWWWKINHAFDHLDVTRTFSGPVLLIEEDHYLVQDFIPVLRMMYRLKLRACRECNIITLGTYDKKPVYGDTSPRVDIMNWVSSKHNMGMSLTRETWNQIRNCTVAFCRFDDYNWDWSLHSVSMNCLQTKLRVMIMKSPRIYHIGECGLHAKGKNCIPDDRVRAIESLLNGNKDYLFPPSLVVNGYPNVPRRVHKANGGWGDIRDHELCVSFVNSETHI